LEISPTGGKLWRLKYRFNGKEKRLAIGIYPAVSIAAARKQRAAAHELLANEIDPGVHRKQRKAQQAERAQDSFEAIARAWFVKYQPTWAASHADEIIKRLENDVFPWLGDQPIAEITAPQLLKLLHRVEGRGALDTAHRVHQNCGQVFRYAVATGRAERDSSGDFRGALPPAKHPPGIHATPGRAGATPAATPDSLPRGARPACEATCHDRPATRARGQRASARARAQSSGEDELGATAKTRVRHRR
jgi:integrase